MGLVFVPLFVTTLLVPFFFAMSLNWSAAVVKKRSAAHSPISRHLKTKCFHTRKQSEPWPRLGNILLPMQSQKNYSSELGSSPFVGTTPLEVPVLSCMFCAFALSAPGVVEVTPWRREPNFFSRCSAKSRVFFPQHGSSDHVTTGHFRQVLRCVPCNHVSAAESD